VCGLADERGANGVARPLLPFCYPCQHDRRPIPNPSLVSQGHSLAAGHHCRDYFRLGSARVNAQRVIDTPARSMHGFLATARCSMWIGKGGDPYNCPPTDPDREIVRSLAFDLVRLSGKEPLQAHTYASMQTARCRVRCSPLFILAARCYNGSSLRGTLEYFGPTHAVLGTCFLAGAVCAHGNILANPSD
jgi:hypothetical protein